MKHISSEKAGDTKELKDKFVFGSLLPRRWNQLINRAIGSAKRANRTPHARIANFINSETGYRSDRRIALRRVASRRCIAPRHSIHRGTGRGIERINDFFPVKKAKKRKRNR